MQFTLQARRAQLDALLMFFTVLSLYCLLRQLLLGGGWRWAFAAGAAAGFGVLAKVVGFLSFFVLVPWLYRRVARLAGRPMAAALVRLAAGGRWDVCSSSPPGSLPLRLAARPIPASRVSR